MKGQLTAARLKCSHNECERVRGQAQLTLNLMLGKSQMFSEWFPVIICCDIQHTYQNRTCEKSY